MPPLIAFHGMLDQVFNYKKKTVLFSKDTIVSGTNYSREGNCLLNDTANYVLHPSGNPDGYLLGGQNIYSMLRRMCVPAECYLDSQMKHGLDKTKDTSKYKSDFGTGLKDADGTGIYIVERAATFLQAVMNNKADQILTTKFVECENYRYGCVSMGDNNNSCTTGTPLCTP